MTVRDVTDVTRLAALFAGHGNAHGTHGVPEYEPAKIKWSIKRTAKTLPQPVTRKLWLAHVKGESPLGVIPIRENNTCSWGSIDYDRYDVDIVDITKKVESTGLPLVPCRSKSGGLHLWLFLDKPEPAADVQAVLQDAAASLGMGECEIFPKQTNLNGGSFGNWILMPYFGGTYDGKLKLQHGIKRTGAEMTLGEFVEFAEKRRTTTMELRLLIKPGAATKKRVKGDFERVAAALDDIPSDSYDDWIRVGAAVHHELGEAGFELFDRWSRKSAKYDAHECAKQWKESCKFTKITGGTILHLAKKARAGNFVTNEKGIILRDHQGNIRSAVEELGGTLWHDAFQDRAIVEGIADVGPLLDDRAIDRLWLLIDERFGFLPSREFFFTVITDAARRKSIHPVRRYLDEVQSKWDGQKRIDTWLIDYARAEDTEFVRAVGRIILTAAVRRVREPGCKFDEIVVLESNQGKNKSSALATLAVNEDWFSDDLPLGADSKRTIEALAGKWIVEAAELKGMRKSEVEQLKSFLSRRVDRARMSYDRQVTTVPRQCVFFGSTNSEEYLRDGTGNRRFWPVKVGTFDLDKLLRDRDQLWAEAAVREVAGESIRLEPSLWNAAAEVQDVRTVEDPYRIAISSVLGDLEGKIRSQDVWPILGVEPGRQTQDHNARLGEAMRSLGFTSVRRRFGGAKEYAYVRGDESLLIKVERDDDGRLFAINDEPGAVPAEVITRTMIVHRETEKGVLVSVDGGPEVWLPKSQIDWGPKADDSCEITLPLWLAKRHGLAAGPVSSELPF